MRKVVFAFVAAALVVPAYAASDNSSAQTQQQKPKKEKKICKHVDTTESRMGKTICKTQAEWDGPVTDDAQKIGYKQ